MSIYDFTVKTNHGEEKSLADYKGKVLIIVNTASKCGFTPQYEELENLYEKYHSQGFEILDFPCNQFASTYFNGGGHKNASGGEFYGSLSEAVAVFEKGLQEFNPNKSEDLGKHA
mgnify:CR=1 FL=1